MNDLWLANHSVRRWHTQPTMHHLCQTNADHVAGMMALGIMIWPDMSRDLMMAILTHDAAESVTGDMPWGGKQLCPELADAMAYAEVSVAVVCGWNNETTTDTEYHMLKFLDRLEPFRYVTMHAPHFLDQQDWMDAREWLIDRAFRFGVLDKVRGWLESAK